MRHSVAGLVAIVVLATAGCTASSPTTGITVTVTGDRCSVTPASTESGTVLFTVTNSGDEVAAVQILSAGTSLGRLGNLAPEISRDLVLVLAAGDYAVECTPGPAAQSITTGLSVTDSGATITLPTTTGVSESYLEWVRATTSALRDATGALAAAFDAGDPGGPKLYREARALWASLRPAVQRFPELLPPIDARESDLVVGERLSGWHAIERDLWPPSDAEPQSDYEPLDAAERAALSARLQADLAELLDRVDATDANAMDASAVAAGAQELMDAASRALSDEDERWSHAERWLVQGYLDGMIAAIDALRPVLTQDAPELLAEIDQRGIRLQVALDTQAPARELAVCIDSLASALSMIAKDARIVP